VRRGDFRSLAAVVAVGFVGACSSLPGRGLPTLDPCGVRAPPADTIGWVRIPGTQVSPSFLVPPGFVTDDGPPYFLHGGRRWRHLDGRTLEVAGGHWGEESFRPMTPVPAGTHAECYDTIAGERVLLTAMRRHGDYAASDGKYTVVAWFPDRRGPLGGGVLIGSGPRRADQEFFLALFRTARFPK
jgi:hypothetical protein